MVRNITGKTAHIINNEFNSMFSVCPSAAFFRLFVCLFVQIDLATMMSHELYEQSRWNLQGMFTSPY